MPTNQVFNERELKLLLITILKTRNLLFDCVEMKFDKRSLEKPVNQNPTWRGNRGTIPILDDLNNLLALVRLHINSEETINMYDAMGMFDHPVNKEKKRS